MRSARDPTRDQGVAQPVRVLATADLTPRDLAAIRALLDAAFGTGEEAFADADWQHAIGGTHFIVELDGEIVSHASVVQRTIEIDGRPLRTGYVEAVATAPGRHGEGLGSAVMTAASQHIRERFELGALGTGRHSFYERLGWETWRGPTSVRMPDGQRVRSPAEDGDVMILRTPRTPDRLDLDGPIAVDWRAEEPW